METNQKTVTDNDFDVIYRSRKVVKPKSDDGPDLSGVVGRLTEDEITVFSQLSNSMDIVDDSLVDDLDPNKVCFKIREALRCTAYSNRNISDQKLTPADFATKMSSVLADRIVIRPNDDHSDIMIGYVTPIEKTEDGLRYEIYEEPMYRPAGFINETGLPTGTQTEFLSTRIPDRKENAQ